MSSEQAKQVNQLSDELLKVIQGFNILPTLKNLKKKFESSPDFNVIKYYREDDYSGKEELEVSWLPKKVILYWFYHFGSCTECDRFEEAEHKMWYKEEHEIEQILKQEQEWIVDQCQIGLSSKEAEIAPSVRMIRSFTKPTLPVRATVPAPVSIQGKTLRELFQEMGYDGFSREIGIVIGGVVMEKLRGLGFLSFTKVERDGIMVNLYPQPILPIVKDTIQLFVQTKILG